MPDISREGLGLYAALGRAVFTLRFPWQNLMAATWEGDLTLAKTFFQSPLLPGSPPAGSAKSHSPDFYKHVGAHCVPF